ncbi:unnamed protein product [Sphagnum jensenii]
MRGKLLQLYNDHYRAGCMKLAILGGEQLDTLSQWAVKLFGGVRQGGKEQMKFSTWKPPDPIWEPAGCMYHIESVTDQHLLVLRVQVACYCYQGEKVGEQVCQKLELQMVALPKAVLATCFMWLQLTTSGLQHVKLMINSPELSKDLPNVSVFDVVGFLHQYIKMLCTIGPQEWVFKELQSISNMEFQFAEDIAAADHVVTLASVKFEPWFEIAYTVETISKEILQAWADPAHVHSALHMPSPNEFIPHNFSIYIQTIAAKNNKCDSIKSSLVVLLDEPALRLWYKLDQTFQMPWANAFFSVLTRTASNSVKAAVLTEMYENLLLHELNETMYLANMVNLESSITVHGFKLELKLFGFNEKLPVLVRRIMEFHQSLVVTPELFQAIKEDMERAFRNAETNPLTHSSYLRLQALKSRFWHVDDQLTCLLSLSTTDLTKFIPTLFHKTYIEALCHGNLLEVEALDIANIFKKALVRNPLPPRQRPQDLIIKLPASICLLLQENVKNMNEENSVAENDMKEDEFESHKDATIEQKLEVNCSLLDETDRYWDNIWDQRWGGVIYHLHFVFLTRLL